MITDKTIQDSLEKLKTVNNSIIYNIEDGITIFTITSEGITGREWLDFLEHKKNEGKGGHIMNEVKNLLLSEDFKPTLNKTRTIAIVKGVQFQGYQFFSDLHSLSSMYRFQELDPESACIVGKKFISKEIDSPQVGNLVAGIVTRVAGDSWLYDSQKFTIGDWLYIYAVKYSHMWPKEDSFAFLLEEKKY